MTCEQFDHLLDAYLDGTLDPVRRGEMDAHLAGCADCLQQTDLMRNVLATAMSLPKSISPPRTLWPDIAARLAPRGGPQPARRIAWRRWAPLAAAAVLLVTVTAVLTFRLSRPGSPGGVPVTSTQPQVAGFAADREYVLAAEDLERVLAEGREHLAPATVAVLERNLALIDAAIAEARAALEADPANADLRALLWGAHRQKLDLLDRATRLTRS
jgi:anti-sigma factor RsiW